MIIGMHPVCVLPVGFAMALGLLTVVAYFAERLKATHDGHQD